MVQEEVGAGEAAAVDHRPRLLTGDDLRLRKEDRTMAVRAIMIRDGGRRKACRCGEQMRELAGGGKGTLVPLVARKVTHYRSAGGGGAGAVA